MRRPLGRRILRGLGFFLIGVPLVLGFGILCVLLWARSDSGRAKLRSVALTQARKQLPGLDFARIGGDLTHTLVLEDVRIRDKEGREAVRAERIRVHFNLLPLLSRTVHVDELTIERPAILGRPGASGKLNLTELVLPSENAKPKNESKPFALDVKQLRIENGALDLATAEGPVFVVSPLNLSASASRHGDVLSAKLPHLALAAEVKEQRYIIDVSELSARVSKDLIEAAIGRIGVVGRTPRGTIVFSGVLSGSARGPLDDVKLDLALAFPEGGQAHLGGAVTLAKNPGDLLRYDLALSVSDLDPHALLAKLSRGELNLRASARGEGTPGQVGGKLSMTLEVTPSRLQGIDIQKLAARADLAGDNWRLHELSARAAGVLAHAHGAGDRKRIALNLDAYVGRPNTGRLPVKGVRGRADLHAQLSGTLPDQLSIRARARGRNVAFSDKQIAAFDLLANADHLPTQPRGTLRLSAQKIRISPTAQPLDTLTLDGQSDGHSLKLLAAGSGPNAKAELALHGKLAPRQADITFDRLSLTLPTQTARLLAPARIRLEMGREVELSGLRVALGGQKASGEVAAQGIYRFRASRKPRLTADVTLRNATLPPFSDIAAHAQARIDQNVAEASLDATLGKAKTPLHVDARVPVVANRRSGTPELATKGPIAAHVVAHNVPLVELPKAGLSRKGLRKGTLDVKAVIEGMVEQPTLHVDASLRDLAYRDLSGLQANLSVVSKPNHTQLDAHASLRGRPLLNLRGESDLALKHVLAKQPLPDAPLNVTLEVPALDTAELVRATDKLAGYGGILRARADLAGTLKHPKGQFSATVANGRVDQLEFGPITVQAKFDDAAVHADVALSEVAGGRLTLRGEYGRKSKTVVADLSAQKLHLDFARAFVPSLRELGGLAQADLHVRGSASAPTVAGQAEIKDGKIGIVGQPTFHDVALLVALAPGRADLKKLHLKSGNGHLDAHGTIDLEGVQVTQVALTASADDFRLAVGGSTGRLDGRFGVHAALRDQVLKGQVEVPQATLWLPKISGQKKLQKTSPHRDLQFVDREGMAAARKAAERQNVSGHERRLDLSAKAGTIYLRSKDINLEIEAHTKVKTNDEGLPVIEGVIGVRRGSVMIKDQRFEFDHGRIMFNGEAEVNPALDIRLQHQYPEVMAIIDVRGTLQKPELHFSSDPPGQDESQVIGMIMTGGQAGGDPSASQFNATGAITNAILGQLADRLAPELGLDVIRVSGSQSDSEAQTGDQSGTDTRVEVGKYLSPRVYLSFVHVFGAQDNANQNEAHVEYRMTRRWVMETAFGDAGVGGVDFLWTWRY